MKEKVSYEPSHLVVDDIRPIPEGGIEDVQDGVRSRLMVSHGPSEYKKTQADLGYPKPAEVVETATPFAMAGGLRILTYRKITTQPLPDGSKEVKTEEVKTTLAADGKKEQQVTSSMQHVQPSVPKRVTNILHSIGNGIGSAVTTLSNLFGSPIDELKLLTEEQKEKLKVLYPRGFNREMKQGVSMGDCYFVAMLYGCNKNPVMPYVVADTVHFISEDVATIDFIGRTSDEKTVAIDMRHDLDGQVVVYGDGSEEMKFPLAGQPGDRVLERAFARQRKLKMHGGYSGAAATQRKYTMLAGQGGHSTEPLSLLFGDLATSVQAGRYGYSSLDKAGSKREYEDLLSKFARDPTGYILTAVTPAPHETPYYKEIYRPEEVERGEGGNYFMDPDFFFFQFHAFTVTDVNEAARTVTIVNPHNTGRLRKTISFEEFGRYFSVLYGVKLDKKRANNYFRANIFEQ